MGTKTRVITTAIGIASALGIAGVVGTAGGDGASVHAARSASVHAAVGSSAHASADAVERRALATTEPAATCDAGDFTGSPDAYERLSAGCVEPVVVFYGSPDSVERQGGR